MGIVKDKDYLKVVSASRRVDLAAVYPDQFIKLLREKTPPDKTHTLVIWTKNPSNLIKNSVLKNELLKYESIFLHLTVTGMGGTSLEPKTPKPEDIFRLLPEIAEFVGGGLHIRLRFDPIVHIKMNDGTIYSNLSLYPIIARNAQECGVLNVSISWMQIYKKVIRNMKSKDLEPIHIPNSQMLEELSFLQKISHEYGISLYGCCVPVLPVSKCIDGYLLSRIHPRQLKCSTAKAKGQRQLCGCTESLDIGWYEPCLHGCIYCYANPQIIP